MEIQTGTAEHAEHWAQLRAELWQDHSVAHHCNELTRTFLAGNETEAAFMALTNTGELVGFAEAALRSDYVNGCDTSPVVFLEGIYVRPENRRMGVARLLCDAVEAWGRSLESVLNNLWRVWRCFDSRPLKRRALNAQALLVG